jgi:hypothetical protein
MIVQGSCLSLDNGQPGRNAGPSTVSQTVVIFVYIAEIPLDSGPRIDHLIQIYTITGAAPFGCKIHNDKGAWINELE